MPHTPKSDSPKPKPFNNNNPNIKIINSMPYITGDKIVNMFDGRVGLNIKRYMTDSINNRKIIFKILAIGVLLLDLKMLDVAL